MFDLDGIIPDIIDVDPVAVLKVNFPSGDSVKIGKELTPTQVKDQPNVSWDADGSALYTLLMIDPDAPSRANPTSRECLHWLVINIPGNNVASGQTIAEYGGAGPSEDSGLHRYCFLVFKQADKITSTKFIPKTQIEGRVSVKTRDYIAKFKLGNAVAGTYFQAKYDSYVPILRAQMQKPS